MRLPNRWDVGAARVKCLKCCTVLGRACRAKPVADDRQRWDDGF